VSDANIAAPEPEAELRGPEHPQLALGMTLSREQPGRSVIPMSFSESAVRARWRCDAVIQHTYHRDSTVLWESVTVLRGSGACDTKAHSWRSKRRRNRCLVVPHPLLVPSVSGCNKLQPFDMTLLPPLNYALVKICSAQVPAYT
jgi:hypothetical protein